ncbi:MAG: ABC transporter ATP-binding protein [Cyanobacteria bacterium P01_A01_bin.45]
MANVRLENIKRKFNNVTAIEDISFEVPDGEFWVLVGPSGCGKSTILRTIAGLETATSGKLYIGNQIVNEIPARQRNVAMVFQNYALYPHMSVAQNIAFGLQMRQMNQEIIRDRVQSVARSLALEHLLDRKPKQLSGGQQQRVALGRALARQAEVFLLDEPLSNLDAQLRDDTRAELKQIHQKLRNTTVYVTHDQIEAMTLADKIVVLNGGKIQQIGTPQDVYAQPLNRMVATFLGSPPMNIIPAKYIGDRFDIYGQFISVPNILKDQLNFLLGKNFDLGIRPEHISIQADDNTEEEQFLEVVVNVVEPLGRETLIRGSLPDSTIPINVQAGAQIQPEPGSNLKLKLDLNHLFVFDSVSGDRLFSKTAI